MAIAHLQITVFFRREGKDVIAFAPALELSSAGRTRAEARRNFERALELFLESLEKMGTFDQALRDLGWRKLTSAGRPWQPPHLPVPTHLLGRTPMRIPLPA